MTSYAAPEANNPAQYSIPVSREFENARRHSRIVLALKFVLPVCVIVLIGGFLYASGAFSPSLKLETKKYSAEVQSIQLDQNSVKMMNPKIVTQSDETGAYELRARSATRRIDNPDIFKLDMVDATMTRRSGGWAKMQADKGTYNKKSDTLDLAMNIKISSDRGFTAYMDKARMDVKSGDLVTDRKVLVDMPNGTIRANRMKILNRGTLFRFEKRAHMKLILKQKGQ